MTAAQRIYFPTQPRRCADEDAGMSGICLACGSRPGDLCRAPVVDRYRPAARQRT